MLVQVTVVPTFTVIDEGLKTEFWMLTALEIGVVVVVGGSVVVFVRVMVVVGG